MKRRITLVVRFRSAEVICRGLIDTKAYRGRAWAISAWSVLFRLWELSGILVDLRDIELMYYQNGELCAMGFNEACDIIKPKDW